MIEKLLYFLAILSRRRARKLESIEDGENKTERTKNESIKSESTKMKVKK